MNPFDPTAKSLRSDMFKSMTRELYPKTIQEMLEWGLELWNHHGVYSQALRRAVLYFVTRIELEGDDNFEINLKHDYEDRINDHFSFSSDVAAVGYDYVGFGNSFASVSIPFVRYLICPKCGAQRPLRELHAHYSLTPAGEFTGSCVGNQGVYSCRYSGPLKVMDTPDPNRKGSNIRWPPQYITLQTHPLTKRKIISLKLNEYMDLTAPIRSRDPLFMEDTELGLIQAAMRGEDFRFDPDRIYHMASQSVAMEEPFLKGWGKPLFMCEFEDAVILRVLDRYNEIIMADGVCPFRIISPPPQVTGLGGAGDPMLQASSGDFAAKAQDLLNKHRNNPAAFNLFPFPLQYQTMGGDAQQMAPIDTMRYLEERLLRSIGVPLEFISGSLHSVAATLISFRMYERFWSGLLTELNKYVTWVTQQQGQQWGWEMLTARLTPISVLEDENEKGLKLDLMGAGKISEDTGLAAVGLDANRERRKMMAEQERIEEEMQKQQTRMQEKAESSEAIRTMGPGAVMLQEEQAAAEQAAAAEQQQGGGAPPPQGPMPAMGGGAPGGSATLDDLAMEAEQMATELFQMDDLTRRRQLQSLKHNNETLYHQVKGALESMRQNAGLQGIHMAQQGQAPLPPA